MVTHSSILTWEIPWTEEPGKLQSMGPQKCQTWLVTKQQQEMIYKLTGITGLVLNIIESHVTLFPVLFFQVFPFLLSKGNSWRTMRVAWPFSFIWEGYSTLISPLDWPDWNLQSPVHRMVQGLMCKVNSGI